MKPEEIDQRSVTINKLHDEWCVKPWTTAQGHPLSCARRSEALATCLSYRQAVQAVDAGMAVAFEKAAEVADEHTRYINHYAHPDPYDIGCDDTARSIAASLRALVREKDNE